MICKNSLLLYKCKYFYFVYVGFFCQINTAKGILDTILSVQPKESSGGKAGETREAIVFRYEIFNFLNVFLETPVGKNMCFILLQDCGRHAQEATKVRELTTMDIESKFAKRPVPVDIFF